jgi:hypothetical protein
MQNKNKFHVNLWAKLRGALPSRTTFVAASAPGKKGDFAPASTQHNKLKYQKRTSTKV